MRFLLVLSFLFSINIFSNEVNDFKLHCSNSWYGYGEIKFNHFSIAREEYFLSYASSTQILNLLVYKVDNARPSLKEDDYLHLYKLIEANEKDITFKMIDDKRNTKWESFIASNLNLNRSALVLDTGRIKKSLYEKEIRCKIIDKDRFDYAMVIAKSHSETMERVRESEKKEQEEKARNKI